MTIPMMLAAGPLVGFVIGAYLDRWLGWAPWITVIMSLLGFAAGVNETIQIIRKIQRQDRNGT